MRFGTMTRWLTPAACLALTLVHAAPGLGDEPTRLGRLFRMGSGTSSSPAAPGGSAPGPAASSFGGGASGSTSTSSLSSTGSNRLPADPYAPPALSTPPSHVGAAGSAVAPAPRIAPKSRVNKGITDADPLVSRVALGRADGGGQFAMLMQVFADGTVIDSEGVHKISAEMLKPVVEAVGSGDFGKIKGHCGGPAGDTYENFQVVTFERAYGRLRANAFSYSGNPQGCDHAVFHLHKVLDELQMKMATPVGAAGTVAAAMTPAVVNPPMTGPATYNPDLHAPLDLNAPVVSSAPVATDLKNAGSGIGRPNATLAMPGLPDPGLH